MKELKQMSSRRQFIKMTGLGAAALGLQQIGCKGGTKSSLPQIKDLESVQEKPDTSQVWIPISDRKIRVGLIGYGLCKFSAAFGFQNHPMLK